jgi:hypothetical protein
VVKIYSRHFHYLCRFEKKAIFERKVLPVSKELLPVLKENCCRFRKIHRPGVKSISLLTEVKINVLALLIMLSQFNPFSIFIVFTLCVTYLSSVGIDYGSEINKYLSSQFHIPLLSLLLLCAAKVL